MLIEIYSDVVCPWCYIGKRRLDTVLEGPLGEDVRVVWRPYQLHRGLPPGGLDRADYLARRYGADADPARVPERIRAEAEDAGLRFDFAAMTRMPNTRDAHRLLNWAYPSGQQHRLAETLFSYYFTEGQDVGDIATLVEAAAAVGLDGEQARALLTSDVGAADLDADLNRALDASVAGVPHYLLAERFTLPGAQTADVMQRFIERAQAVLHREANEG